MCSHLSWFFDSLVIWFVFSIFWAIFPNFTMQRISVVFESCTCFTVFRKKNLYSHSCSTFVSDGVYDSRNAYRRYSITYVRIIQSTKRLKPFSGFQLPQKCLVLPSGYAVPLAPTWLILLHDLSPANIIDLRKVSFVQDGMVLQNL